MSEKLKAMAIVQENIPKFLIYLDFRTDQPPEIQLSIDNTAVGALDSEET